MGVQVTVRYPDGQGQCFPFDKDALLCGRTADNDIQLTHSYVSGRHFRLHRQGGSFFVEDLGSTNGTLLNGRVVERRTSCALAVGDLIQIGQLEVRLEEASGRTVVAGRASRGKDPHPTLVERRSGGNRVPPGRHPVAVQTALPRQGFEERILAGCPEVPFRPSPWGVPWGTVSQILGAALLAMSAAALVVIVFG